MTLLQIIFLVYLVLFAIAVIRFVVTYFLNSSPKITKWTEEPELDIKEIQGDTLLGFNKPFSLYACYNFSADKIVEAKKFLSAIADDVTSCHDIINYRQGFREFRAKHEPKGDVNAKDKAKKAAFDVLNQNPNHELQVTWLNISFSYNALSKLTNNDQKLLAVFQGNIVTGQSAFENGLPNRATGVCNDRREAAPENWIDGFQANPDIFLHIGSDNQQLADEKFQAINALAQENGLTLIYKQLGNHLIHPQTSKYGLEHFGFSDGVSQPSYRGTYKVNDSELRVLTERKLSQDDPNYLRYSVPGTELTWPGDLVLGYPTCDRASANPLAYQPANKKITSNKLAMNGSFAVFRILKQDVASFWNSMQRHSKKLNVSDEFVAAKCVGRWKDATPLVYSPTEQDPKIGQDDMKTNAFAYESDSITYTLKDGTSFHSNSPDKLGKKCPIGAHIRRCEPRDQPFGIAGVADYVIKAFNFMFGNIISTQDLHISRRLARRAIPYNPRMLTANKDGKYIDDGEDRGLLFVCYQTSIENQFEFVQAFWCNNDQFPTSDVGHDMIVGQSVDGKRYLKIPMQGNENATIETNKLYVIPRGGGYFFSPAKSAIKDILAK